MSAGDKAIIIGRGKNGWHYDGLTYWKDGSSNTMSCSGGDLETYLKEAIEGAYIYDAVEADTDAFASFVIGGPMVSVELKPGTIKGFADKEMLAAMLPSLGGSFKEIGAMALTGLSSLDFIAPDLYIAMLRDKVPGCKTGRVMGGVIVWDPPACPKETDSGQLPLFV